MTENNKKIVTRFAPSPTGFMHVGGVRTALYAWLLARKHDGEFILRIEDTDKEREVEGSIDHIMRSLEWLGLDWDQGPRIGGPHGSYIQSERLSIYKDYAEKLIGKGLAYADPYSDEELENFRKKAEEEKRPFLYREHRPENLPQWDGSQPLRFKTPTLKRYEWHDEVWGDLSAGEEALDDFILIKSDGYPTYNFAHIVDDIEMEVTHVMRGQEFISSTPKFLSVYEALEVNPPIFATLPPIMGPDGKKKLGKRDGAKDILEYEKEGYLSEAMINFLALLGWNPGDDREVLTRAELIDAFDLSKVQHSGARLNEEKLLWLNKEHMKLIPESERTDIIFAHISAHQTLAHYEKAKDKAYVAKIAPVIFDHISKWSDIETMIREGELGYYFTSPEYDPTLLLWKGKIQKETAHKHLSWLQSTLAGTDQSNFESPEKIKAVIFDYATEQGRGDVLWPLRVTLSGKEKSPDPFTLLYILGKDECLARIKYALSKITTNE